MSLAFGNVSVGSSSAQSLTVTNTGTATVNISQATISGSAFTVVGGNPSASIGVGQSSTLQIQFAPQSQGAITGSLTIVSDASNSPLTISFTGTGTQPGLTISPSSINFGNVTVGQSSTQSVQLTNNGNASVTINLATVSGNGFGISGLSLPATISASQSLSFSVRFAPASTGGVTGNISFTDNAPGSPQNLPLSGAGIASNATLIASPASVAFGAVAVGTVSQQTITLSNSGTTSITISQGSASGTGFTMTGLTTPLVLAASQSATFTAQFAPTTAGNASGVITISSDATNPTLTLALSGTGTQGTLSANPASINFGSLLVGSSGSVSVTLSNTGAAGITITAASASGAGFSISGLSVPLTLGAGQNTSFTAKFSPASTGSATGSISITSNAPGSPLTIALAGIGVQPQLSANPTSVNFGNVVTGTNNSQTITLTNGGSASVTVSQATASGTGFSTTGLNVPLTIAAGNSATFNAVFAPAAAGAVTGSVVLVSNAPSSPLAISLSGTGVAATFLLGVNPTSLGFGNVTVNSNSTLTATLKNNGNSNITISSVTASGTGFSTNGVTAGLVLTPTQSATLNVVFAPTSAGNVTGSVTITCNATNSPATISLTGSGVLPHSVALSWTASTSTGVVGYFVYRGTVSGGPYTKLNPSPDALTQYTDSVVQSGKTYFYVVTAVDSSNVESADSNQATAAIP